MIKKSPKISIIVAAAENLAIGNNNQLLWHIPEDLKRFKQVTTGHPVIMGQNTYESIGKVLPGRTNIVLSKTRSFKDPDCHVFNSFKKAIEFAKKRENKEIFIIGGGQVYKQAINFADKLYLTLVKGNFKADTFFPDYSKFSKVIFRKKSRNKNYEYTFLELERD